MKYRRFAPHFVRKKGIEGAGIFTTKAVAKGKVLFKMHGKILTRPTRTSVEIGRNRHIEDRIAGFINHSCTPNAKVLKKYKSFVSIVKIKKGDEITFDYNKNESKLAAPFRCRCCHRKIIGKKALALRKK
jgi:SET domain-containing protein